MNGLPVRKMSEDAQNVNPFIGTEKKENEIPYGYCHCGCGKKTSIAKKTNSKWGHIKGLPVRFITGHHIRIINKNRVNPLIKGLKLHSDNRVLLYEPNHPRAQRGYVFSSIINAEKALGKYLPNHAVVHHHNKIKVDDSNNNLVICENQSYHLLLHRRTTALKECGNANWRKCHYCHKYDDLDNLHINKSSCYHRICKSLYDKGRGH